jgi:hypothetical protein
MSWRDDAECISIPIEMFFNEGHYGNGNDHESLMVKKICSTCLVTDECLDAALQYERTLGKNHRAGIWGGLGPRERYILWQKIRPADDNLCKNGHVMDDENAYENPGGYVQCRQCKEIQKNLWKLRKREQRAG